MNQSKHLLTPTRIGDLEVPNRIVMSPMTRSRTPGGVPNALNAQYYAQRASAGMIFAESTAVSPFGIGFTDTPGIFTDDQAAGWANVTRAVHEQGGRIGLQLWHSGHYSHRFLLPGGALPIGPSARAIKGSVRTPQGRLPVEVPRELSAGEVAGVVAEYRSAAVRALDAGFDLVEIHGGNGYLIDQFLRDSTNHRTDEYGGSPENRMRLLLEVVAAVCEVWGVSRVGVRLSPTNPSVFGITDSAPEILFPRVVEALDAAGIAFIDVVEGGTGDSPAQCDFDYDDLRRRFSRTYIANNSYSPDLAGETIASGRADLVAFGRPFIANPDLVQRIARGDALAAVDMTTLYAQGTSGYVDYPALQQQR